MDVHADKDPNKATQKKPQKHDCVTTNTYSNRENYFSQKYEN